MTDWRTAAAGGKLHVLTWFGSFLQTSKDDWIVHAPLKGASDLSNCLYIEDQSNEERWTSLLWQYVPRPRRLPTVEINRLPNGCYSLKDVPAGSSGTAGFYMSALPDGCIDITREQVAGWETFHLLREDQHEKLDHFLTFGRVVTTGGELHDLELSEGFTIKSAGRELSMPDVLEFLADEDRLSHPTTTLHDTSRRLVDVIYRRPSAQLSDGTTG